VKRNPGQASPHDPGFRFAQSGLLPRLHDHLINFDPKLRGGAVEIARGKEGVQKRLGSCLAPRYFFSNAQACIRPVDASVAVAGRFDRNAVAAETAAIAIRRPILRSSRRRFMPGEVRCFRAMRLT
jgi:hypothetical protein